MSQALPDPSAEWATYHWSCIKPHDRPDTWVALVLIGDCWQVQHIGHREDVLREARKYGNRLKRQAERRKV